MNQGILTSIFALGSIIVFIGSWMFIGESVKPCEYFGTLLVIIGTIGIAMSKKGNAGSIESPADNLESPAIAILFALGGAICFGVRSCTLKYLAIKEGIDGVSASAVFLMVDGTVGGIVGIILTICGLGYAQFPGW